MYRLHCSKCDNVIEPHDNFFKLSYTEFGVGNFAAAPRHCEICAACFTDFKRAIDWEIGRCEENADMVKPPIIGCLTTTVQNTCN